jgi:hypothetical protein
MLNAVSIVLGFKSQKPSAESFRRAGASQSRVAPICRTAKCDMPYGRSRSRTEMAKFYNRFRHNAENIYSFLSAFLPRHRLFKVEDAVAR